jgi:hypothetical protein
MLQTDAYMVPPQVYVGDRASLVLPMPGLAADVEISLENIPSSANLVIHQAVLERRPSGSYLTIEFSAYAPGTLELPPLEIAGEIYSGLKVEISSILATDESGMVLSGPAPPLALPGTSFMVYGTLSATILIMLLAIWSMVWGRKRIENWLAALKRKRLLVSMLAIEKRLQRALAKGVPCRKILDVLSAEFRSFLSNLTGENYRSMTAAEIGLLQTMGEQTNMGGEFLGRFFNNCDALRFSGREINGDETLAMLGDMRSFVHTLNRSRREKAA